MSLAMPDEPVPGSARRGLCERHMTCFGASAAEREFLSPSARQQEPSMPLISIVLPTHRREYLLKTALASICASSGFEDYEVVVYDNSSDASAESVVRPFDDPRIRYFNTGKDLDVYASWIYAIE